MRDGVRERIEKCFRESNVRMRGNLDLASLDMIVVAVRIENEFGIKFRLDEISMEHFQSTEGIAALVEKHLEAKPR